MESTSTSTSTSNLIAEPSTSTSQSDQSSKSIQQNRLIAKYQLRSKQLTQSTSTQDLHQIKSKKRPQNQIQSDSSTTSNLKPLPNLIGKYVDYDLSTLKNSKGGFLLNSEEENQKLLKQNQQVEELKKQRLKQIERFHQNQLSLDPNQNPKCKVCSSIELDIQIYNAFRVPVCKTCKNNYPDRFSLLTKTECKEDYLLTDPELKDTELLPHLLKANPHQSTYSNMMLYLREQVEEYAFSSKKWGSSENLDEEFQRRTNVKKQKKSKKFEENLKTLRNQTRKNLYQKRQDEIHVHQFELMSAGSQSNSVQKCLTCGLETECETF